MGGGAGGGEQVGAPEAVLAAAKEGRIPQDAWVAVELSRNDLVALVNVLHRLALSVREVEEMRGRELARALQGWTVVAGQVGVVLLGLVGVIVAGLRWRYAVPVQPLAQSQGGRDLAGDGMHGKKN